MTVTTKRIVDTSKPPAEKGKKLAGRTFTAVAFLPGLTTQSMAVRAVLFLPQSIMKKPTVAISEVTRGALVFRRGGLEGVWREGGCSTLLRLR